MVALAAVLVGLMQFPSIYPDGQSGQVISVHAQPSPTATVVARLTSHGIEQATSACTWSRVLDRRRAPRGCLFAESDYEVPALGVFETSGDWCRIALDNDASGFGWVPCKGVFHSLADLLGSATRLTYLTPDWDRTTFATPGARTGTRHARSADDEVPYRARGHRMMNGRLWLHVDVLDAVCAAAEPRVLFSGWVPAQGPRGEVWAWFWSRGC
jgi:hypothetical protein